MIFKGAWDFIHINWLTFHRFIDEGYTYRASAFAFTSLLALVPLLLVIVFFIALFPTSQAMITLGQDYILANFVPAAAQAMEPYFHVFITQSIHLPTISILFLFATTVMLVHSIEETMNDIWHVPRRKHGYKILALLIHWTAFLLIPFIIGWSMFLSSYVFLMGWIAHTPDTVSHLLLRILPIIINTLILSILYVGVPNVRVKIKDALLGGFIAALLFELARILFAFYVAQFPTYSLIYGAFAIIPIFLIWLYIFWCIVLYGALLIHTHAIEHHLKVKLKP